MNVTFVLVEGYARDACIIYNRCLHKTLSRVFIQGKSTCLIVFHQLYYNFFLLCVNYDKYCFLYMK